MLPSNGVVIIVITRKFLTLDCVNGNYHCCCLLRFPEPAEVDGKISYLSVRCQQLAISWCYHLTAKLYLQDVVTSSHTQLLRSTRVSLSWSTLFMGQLQMFCVGCFTWDVGIVFLKSSRLLPLTKALSDSSEPKKRIKYWLCYLEVLFGFRITPNLTNSFHTEM